MMERAKELLAIICLCITNIFHKQLLTYIEISNSRLLKDLSQLYLLAHQTKSGSKWDAFKKNIVRCFTDHPIIDTAELNKILSLQMQVFKIRSKRRAFIRQENKDYKGNFAQLFPELLRLIFEKAMKQFRSLYTRLNRHIDTAEIKECSGYKEIDFNRVPGRALNIQRKAFLNTTKNGGEELRHPETQIV